MTEKEISKQITRYINGELNDREEDLLWEEFLRNKKYYQLFQTELNLADLYRNKSFRIDESGSQSPPKRLFNVWTVSLAALIIISSMLYIFSFQNNTQPSSYALTQIELTQMLGSSIFRNENPDAAQIDQQINRALALALSGNSKDATGILNGIADDSLTGTQKVLVNYNLGILAYNDANYDQCLDYFSELDRDFAAVTPDHVVENIQWYISNIYLKQDKVEQSVQLLKQIAAAEGNNAGKAGNLLLKLDE